MARLWSSGFELNSIGNGVEWQQSGGSPVISSTVFRSGSYSTQITGMTSGASMGYRYGFISAPANGPYYTRTYFRVDTYPSAENRIITLRDTNVGADRVWITIDSVGDLRLYDEDGQISGTTSLSTGTWYRIENEVDRTGAGGAHVIKARVDGTEFAAATNRNLSTGVDTYRVGGNLNTEAQTTGDWYFDDIAVNDSVGGSENTYPGQGELIHLRPDSAGDNEDWASGTGSTFAEVDEVTPDNATTHIASSTSGHISDFNCAATPAALSSDDVINCVQVGWRFRTNSTVGTNPIVVLRVKKESGGTVTESANTTFSSTTWVTNSIASPRNHLITLYNDPDGNPWTKSTLDSLQVGVRLTNASTGLAQVSTLWVLVDHKPAVSVAATANTYMTTNTRFLG